MNHRIFNYEVERSLMLPYGGRIIHLAPQNETICIWVEFDEENLDFFEERTFRVIATGQTFTPDPAHTFLGTALLHNGALVLHVYETTSY